METVKAFNIIDFYKVVETEKDPVSYINYWKEPSTSLLKKYEAQYEIDTREEICSECKVCQMTHIEKYKNRFPDPPSLSEKKHLESNGKEPHSHAWQISCPKIYKDYRDLLGSSVLDVSSNEDIDSYISILDPVTFAKKLFAWKPRKHQELALRCQSKRKVLRWGRRAGKSEMFAMEVLWHAFTKSKTYISPDSGEIIQGLKIIIVAPYESQIIEIFDKIYTFLLRSEATKNAIKVFRKAPFHHLELLNGCQIKGFTTGNHGAESLRGQDAHVIFLDEADYMSEDDFKTIMPLVQSHSDVLIRTASTPAGKREKYFSWCEDLPQWKEFYFPTPVIDETPFEQIKMRWSDLRREIRPEYSHDAWLQEVLAIFVASSVGVYQPSFVANAQKDYTYKSMHEAKANGEIIGGWTFSLGVDWNSNAGTWICVLGHNRQAGFQVMDFINVPKQDFTQFKGLKKIVETLELWQPKYIYLDAGYGAAQAEMLSIWSLEQPTNSYGKTVADKIKRYDFGGKVEVRDPATGGLVKHPSKAFMVESSVRKFEDGVIKFSKDDDLLRKQLLNYIVASRSESNKPIYGCENASIGDHALDALNLAIVAFTLEESVLASTGQDFSPSVGVVGSAMNALEMTKMRNGKPIRPDMADRHDKATIRKAHEERIKETSKRSMDIIEVVDNKLPVFRHGFLSDTEGQYSSSSFNKRNPIKKRMISRTRGL